MAQPRYRIQFMSSGSWQPIAYVEESVSVTWSRKLNDVGEAKIVLPDIYPPSMFPRDTRILIWRNSDFDTTLAGKTIWLARKITRDLGDKTIEFTAKDANALIENRLVAYTSETSYADKTQEQYDNDAANPVTPTYTPAAMPVSDDMIKEFVYENMSTGALDTSRRIPANLFKVEADQSLGTYVEQTGSYQNLLDVIKSVAKQSSDAGTPIFFDMVPDVSNGSFLFRTWAHFRGRDRTKNSDNPLTFSQELENLSKVTLEFDYETEYNVLHFLGKGSGSGQVTEVFVNEASVRNDPFGRREFMTQDEYREGRDDYMENVARGLLDGATAKVTMRGETVDTPLARYGIDYDFGDIVSAQASGYEFDCFVTAVSAKYSDGEEKVSVKLESTIQVLT